MTRRVIPAVPGAVGGSHATCTTWIVHMLSLITRPRNIVPGRTWRRSRNRGCCRFGSGSRWRVVGRTVSVEHGCAGRGTDANGSERCCCQDHLNLSLHSHGDLHLGKRCNVSVSAHALCDPLGIPKSAPNCLRQKSSSNRRHGSATEGCTVSAANARCELDGIAPVACQGSSTSRIGGADIGVQH